MKVWPNKSSPTNLRWRAADIYVFVYTSGTLAIRLEIDKCSLHARVLAWPATQHYTENSVHPISLVLRPHPQRGKGSGDFWANSWLCRVSNTSFIMWLRSFTTHVSCAQICNNYLYLNLIGASEFLRSYLDQALSPKSPDPFPLCGWGWGRD